MTANLLRTVLSLLGIAVGIFSIISVYAVVDSLERNIRQSVQGLGTDVVYIQKWPWGGGGGARAERGSGFFVPPTPALLPARPRAGYRTSRRCGSAGASVDAADEAGASVELVESVDSASVELPPAPEGRLRRATEDDAELVLAWFTAFQA